MESIAKTIAPIVIEAAVDKGKNIAKKFMSKEKNQKNAQRRVERKEKQQRPRSAATTKPKPMDPGPKQRPAVNMPRRGAVDIPTRRVFSLPRITFNHKYTKMGNVDAMDIEGCDLYGSIGNTNATAYSEIYSLPLNPLAISGTRLSVESFLWTKFRFEMVEMIFVPQKSTNTDGLLLLSHVEDPELPLPAPQTLDFATALSAVKGSTAGQVFMEQKHVWKPTNTDKREFYIYPDMEDEERLTMQGNMKIVDMTGMNIASMGFLYVHYKLRLYERVIVPTYATGWQKRTINFSGPLSGSNWNLTDNGVLGSMRVTIPGSDPLVLVGQVYVCMFNFERGGLRALQYVYFKVATFSTATDLYYNPKDANSVTGENVVTGSFMGGGGLPSNATVWVAQASQMPGPGKAPTQVTRLEDALRAKEHDIDDLKDSMYAMQLRLEQLETNREIAQLSSPRGAKTNILGVKL